ncbi:MAG TPA: tectonin domain-containing protein [Thermoanaerobaculia bacterium]|nr:tectonin domain-containing protein [Thermoanaerobaculia bacterium]
MIRQVLLYSEDFDAASARIEEAGGRLLHVFSPRAFVAALPADVDPRALPNVTMIPPQDLDETERILAESWEALQQQQATNRFTVMAGSPEVALEWDTPGFVPPDAHAHGEGFSPMAAEPEGVALSTGTPTSLVLTGKVAVGVVTVSGSSWTQMAGALKWVSVGQDGTVWGVNANDDIFRWNGGTWDNIAGKLKQISVGNANNVWGVNAADDIFRWNGSSWDNIAGKLKNVSVGSDGTVWGCNASDDIFRRSGNTWQTIAGKLKQVSVANASTVWGTNADDAIFQWNGSGWNPINGALRVVSAAYDGTVFGVNAADNVFRYLGNNAWQTMPAALTQISAASLTNLWGVNGANDIFRGNSSSGLNFAQSEIAKIVAEVQEGLNFLASAEPLARITFFYDWRPITVSATPGPVALPIANPFEAMEAPWRNAALQAMGFSGDLQGSLAYVISIKQKFNTDWAYVAYFTKYPLNHFAYATGERLVMQYANDGWGPDAINQVFAHESGHIFGAADEYGSCVCAASGFHKIANGNCKNCTGSQAACLMNANTLSLCNFSRGQIGWSTWEQVQGALKWVSAGSDGTVWGVNASDDIFRYQGNNSWQNVGGKLKQISVGNANNVWGVNASDDIFRRSGNGWQQVTGKLKNVSVAPDGTVWGCNANDDIFRFLGNNQWQNVGGKLRQISVGGANIVWGVNAAGDIFRRIGNNWQQVPGALVCVAAASDGTVWGVNAANNIFRYDAASNGWTTTQGGLKEISAGAANQIWGVNASDQIFQRRILSTP